MDSPEQGPSEEVRNFKAPETDYSGKILRGLGPDYVEDPDKARFMANHENVDRINAVELKRASDGLKELAKQFPPVDGREHPIAKDLLLKAAQYERGEVLSTIAAEKEGEDAGRLYDAMHEKKDEL